jgi:very-short-patch-repair endonuclease
MAAVPNAVLKALLESQCGVISRTQALDAGVTRGAIREHLAAGRWQRLSPGVYATFSGVVPRVARLWAVVLAAGPDAVLSHETAAELADIIDRPCPAVHVTVPHGRKVRPMAGVVVHRSRNIDKLRHPVKEPPQTRIEETIIDLAQAARSITDAYGWCARAVNAGKTTAGRLLDALQQRPRVRRRQLLREGLGDVLAGCRSVLELSYLRKVERAHGLPKGERQVRVTRARLRNYLDVLYRRYTLNVELDGEAAHPYAERFRDRHRDNVGVVAGSASLRYGTADVEERPCEVAVEVATVLRRRGWAGRPRRCSRADCPLPSSG